MQLKPIAAIIVLVVASLFVAGCTTQLSNPLASKSDYSATFAKIMETQTGGGTPITPISQLTDNVYSGSYKMAPDANGKSLTTEGQIEIAKSEAAAKERYGQLVLQKQNEGYVSQSSLVSSSSIWGNEKARWGGIRLNNIASASFSVISYAYNSEINEWIVVSLFGDTISTISQNTPAATPIWARTTTVP
jgi:hypothetical protein